MKYALNIAFTAIILMLGINDVIWAHEYMVNDEKGAAASWCVLGFILISWGVQRITEERNA